MRGKDGPVRAKNLSVRAENGAVRAKSHAVRAENGAVHATNGIVRAKDGPVRDKDESPYQTHAAVEPRSHANNADGRGRRGNGQRNKGPQGQIGALCWLVGVGHRFVGVGIWHS